MLRYFLGSTLLSRTAAPFPTATFVINVSGSFVVGFFLTLATERLGMSAHLRLAVTVGFVGAYTTFSTFEYETLRPAEEHGFHLALLNVRLSVAVGFAAVWGGARPARVVVVGADAPAAGRTKQELCERAADPARHGAVASQRDIRDATAEPPRDV